MMNVFKLVSQAMALFASVSMTFSVAMQTPAVPIETTVTTVTTVTTTLATEQLQLSEKLPQKSVADSFVHADGKVIIGTDGEPLIIKGMALGNSVYLSDTEPNPKHHSESTYKELCAMGFNSVRFYLDYTYFESDSNPYKYKESGFEWLDENIEWAKKYGMGIIFNMHYPQGGYQSQGNGMELWTDVENQNRLSALWTAIAERYADEPAVWGYGLLNEPVVPIKDTMEETTKQYKKLMERLIKDVRKATPYQAIFVEKLCGARDVNGESVDWQYFSKLENTMFIFDDDNIIYEFHCYDPHSFTHQNASWADTAGKFKKYPDDKIAAGDYESYWVDCKRESVRKTVSGWQYFETEAGKLCDDYNIVYAGTSSWKSGAESAVYYDDIQLIEISPSGKRTVIYELNFDTDISDVSSWSSDGTGTAEYCEDKGYGKNGCLKISGAQENFTTSAEHIEMKKGCRYIVAGYAMAENCEPSSYNYQLNFAKASNIRHMNKDYLDSSISAYAEFAEKNNVPVYMGEFGVISEGFKEDRGGIVWVEDMLDICDKYGISFNYHAYHEPSFGLHWSDDYTVPSEKDLNKALAEVFDKILDKIS